MSTSIQSPSSSTLAFVRLCPHCEKVFSKEYSYNRHVSYCRRAQTKRKGRPKSCAGCSAAKAKCSFDKPQCARCSHKGLTCEYDHQKRHLDPLLEAGLGRRSDGLEMGMGTALPTLGGGGMDSLGLDLMQVPDADTLLDQLLQQPEAINAPRGPNRRSPCCRNDPFGWPLVLDNSDDSEQEVEYHVVMFGTQPTLPSSWRPTFPDDQLMTLKWDTLTNGPLGASVADHVANVLLHIIRSFPQMMLRRETFPPYIHKYWYRSALPEKLATCMSISQLFATRTPETKPFLWRTIDAEEQRMRDEFDTYDEHEILSGVQSLIIYMIMAIVDPWEGTASRGIRLMTTFQTMTIKFRTMLGSSCFAETEQSCPSMGWEDWIFQESRRRLVNLWFVISRVMTLDADLPCPDMIAFLEMPLITSKAMWEARTREEWETERAFFQASILHANMSRFRNLIEARRQPHNPLNSAKLDVWEAETDKMGVLMNIAVSLLDQSNG